jgi:hypothetical protein
MTFFDWSGSNGSNMVSKYLWIYVVVTTFFTVLTFGLWYYFAVFRRSRRIQYTTQDILIWDEKLNSVSLDGFTICCGWRALLSLFISYNHHTHRSHCLACLSYDEMRSLPHSCVNVPSFPWLDFEINSKIVTSTALQPPSVYMIMNRILLCNLLLAHFTA